MKQRVFVCPLLLHPCFACIAGWIPGFSTEHHVQLESISEDTHSRKRREVYYTFH